MMPPFVVFPTNRIAHFVEVSLYLFYLAQQVNLRNYCAHNSMVVGMTSSVVLRDPADDVATLPNDNDLFSRLYALKKLLPEDDAISLKNDLIKLLKKSKLDIHTLGILPATWETMFDRINVF